ncbi:MAG TPA: hypothetical protein V6D18_00215 [Thermosynechococcaceae cyanobacterium]
MQHFKRSLQKNLSYLLQGGLALVAVPVGTIGFGLAIAPSASAQAAYGSYIGIGPSVGLTDGSREEPSKVAGVVAGRYKFIAAPISLRTQVLIGNSVAVVPTVSYDIPLSWRADAYIGVGASIPLSGDHTTPVGNQTAFAIQPGIDYALPNSDFVLFGNAIIAFGAYKQGPGPAASVQGGVGVRF